MNTLSYSPVLGHITTFGGHPVSCAASLATLEVLLDENLASQVKEKETLIREMLADHSLVKEIRSAGLLMALELPDFETNKRVIDKAIEKGVIADWFLFNAQSMRIAPPLIISKKEITFACNTIREAMDEVLAGR
jgi:acetylornithine/N-succinyldiaminopimelate aminotransferase